MQQPHSKRSQSELLAAVCSHSDSRDDITNAARAGLLDYQGDMDISPRNFQPSCFDRNTFPPEYHQARVGDSTNETVMNSHGPHCHAIGKGCACCPYLPHLNASFEYSTNHPCCALATNSPNFAQPNIVAAPRTPTQTSMHVTRMHYNHPPSFGSGSQSTVPSQRSNGPSAVGFDVASRASSTPQQSYVSTPDTIYSNASKVNDNRNGSTSATPSGTKQAHDRFRQSNQTISPSQLMRSTSYKDLFQDVGAADASLSEAANVNVNLGVYEGINKFDAYNQELYAGESESEYQDSEQLGISPLAQSRSANLFSFDQPNGQNAYASTFETTANPTLGQDFWSAPSLVDYNTQCFQAANAYSVDTLNTINLQQAANHLQPTDNYDAQNHDQQVYNSMYSHAWVHPLNTLPSNDTTTTDAAPPRARASAKSRTADDRYLDDLLMTMRAQGKSYKAITESYEFEQYVARTGHKLTESTLRGRYRSRTKAPGARLRKPEWPHNAVSTLLFCS